MKLLENIATDIKSDDPKAQREGLKGLREYLQGRDVSVQALLDLGIISALVRWISSHKQYAIVHTAMGVLVQVTHILKTTHGESAPGLPLPESLVLELVQCLIDGLKHMNAFVPCLAAEALENLASCHGRVKDVIKECRFEDALAELQRNRVGNQCFTKVRSLVQCLYDGRFQESNFYSIVYSLTKELLLRLLRLGGSPQVLEDVTSDYISQIEGASTEDLLGILDSWLKLMEDFKDGACDPKHPKCIPLQLISVMKNTSEQVKHSALKCLTQYASVGWHQCVQVIDVGLFEHIGKHVFFVCTRQDTLTLGLHLIQTLVEKTEKVAAKTCAYEGVMTGLDFMYDIGSDYVKEVVKETVRCINRHSTEDYVTKLQRDLLYSDLRKLLT